MTLRDRDGWVIVKMVEDEIKPVSVIRGTREDAETAAKQMPSWFVHDSPVDIKDWRDDK